jgi:hypothetical protein
MIKRFLFVWLLLLISISCSAQTHVRGAVGTATSTTTLTVTLGGAPGLHDLVVGSVELPITGDVLTGACTDSNSNAYTTSVNSPSTFQTGAGKSYMVYLASAPSNATAVINCPITRDNSNTSVAWFDQFTGGTFAFDKDAKNNSSVAGTTINTPTITPTNAGELCYSGAAAGGTISAPAPGATLGVWTGAAGAITSGDMSEYILSHAASNFAVQYTQSSGTWSAMAACFTFSASGGATVVRRHSPGVF